MMTFGSLFAGIGGFDLGLERAGFECRWQVEKDPYCLKVLEKHWPNVKRYEDIRDVEKLEAVDLVCGGFPCQPFSLAGKRGGADDDRYLWPEMLRVIRALRPSWVIGENVPGIINLALDDVLDSLEDAGYACEAFIIPACAVDAPHRRDRVWIVAHACDRKRNPWAEVGKVLQTFQKDGSKHDYAGGRSEAHAEDVANADIRRCGKQKVSEDQQPRRAEVERGGEDVAHTPFELLDRSRRPGPSRRNQYSDGGQDVSDTGCELLEIGREGNRDRRRGAIEQQRGCEGAKWEPEPDVGRVAHGVPGRVDRLRALGNAVVPQIPEVIGRMIFEIENRKGDL